MRLKKAKRYAMTVDTRRCVGCQTCVLACKAENGLPPEGYRAWVTTTTTGSYPNLAMMIRSVRCNHCAVAGCVSACPTGASHYAAGGTVQVDSDLCTGCKACIAACPYDARTIHPSGYADKCTFCLHRVEKGELPACASSCPAGAIVFGDMNDPASEVAKLLKRRKYEVLKPEAGTEPKLFFLV